MPAARLVVGSLAVCAALAGQLAGAQEVPPFPTLYGGRAFLNGQPLQEGTRLTARVDGYETGIDVEVDGVYRNLLVSPPSHDYFGKPVTFHALGFTAEEKDVFLRAASPVFKDQGFDLHFEEGGPGPSKEIFLIVGLAFSAAVFLAVSGGWWLLHIKRLKR